MIKDRSKRCKDHLGHPFPDVRSMYLFWGLTEWAYYHRKHQGWTLEQILTTPVRKMRNNCLDDTEQYKRHLKNRAEYKAYKKVSEVKKELQGGYVVITEYQRGQYMKLQVKEFYSNNLNYEINSQATGVAIGEDGREYYFCYCRTVKRNCFIKETDKKDLIYGDFTFYNDGTIDFKRVTQ